jgi:hypothetical protein
MTEHLFGPDQLHQEVDLVELSPKPLVFIHPESPFGGKVSYV